MEVHFSWALLSGPSGPLSVCSAGAERSASAFTSTIMCSKRALRVWSAHLQQDSQPLGAMSPYSISPTIVSCQCCPGPLVKMSLIMMGKEQWGTFLSFQTSVAGPIQVRIVVHERGISPFLTVYFTLFNGLLYVFYIFCFCLSTCVGGSDTVVEPTVTIVVLQHLLKILNLYI